MPPTLLTPSQTTYDEIERLVKKFKAKPMRMRNDLNEQAAGVSDLQSRARQLRFSLRRTGCPRSFDLQHRPALYRAGHPLQFDLQH